MKRLMMRVAVGMIFCLPALARAETKPTVLDLWPGQVPGEKGNVAAEKFLPHEGKGKPVKRLTNVSKPTISIYQPTKDKNAGAAIVIAPGGGYNILAWDLEGEEVAEWLNSIGVTGVVLKYRVPRRPDQPKNQPPLGALQDAQRAISLVRSRAKSLGIDPKRIGMLGFSAGGHLTAWASTNFDKRAYEPVDKVDEVSCRPDFAVLVYPGGMVRRGQEGLAPEIRVSEKTPPTLCIHAGNDPVNPENSIQMFRALKQAKVPAELHIYGTGGHGFGLRPSKSPSSTWPQRCEAWLRSIGVLKGA